METMRPDSGATKTCPRCAEEIKLAARVCRYCHAAFVVEQHGYCVTCHRVVTPADSEVVCPTCGGPLLDLTVESHLVAQPPAATVPPTAAAEAARPEGNLRSAVVPTLWQFVGANLLSASAVVLFSMPVLGNVFEGLRISERSVGLLEEYEVLGPVYIVIAVAILFAVPRRVFPRRVGGSWLKAKAVTVSYLATLRRELGVRAIYRSDGYVARLVVLAILWALALAMFTAAGVQEGFERRGGATVTQVAIALGLLGTALMAPLRRPRTVVVDDAGRFAPEDAISFPG